MAHYILSNFLEWEKLLLTSLYDVIKELSYAIHQSSIDNHNATATPSCDFNTLWPENNDRHFADGIFKCVVLKKNVLTKISLKFVPMDPVDNKSPIIRWLLGAEEATSH